MSSETSQRSCVREGGRILTNLFFPRSIFAAREPVALHARPYHEHSVPDVPLHPTNASKGCHWQIGTNPAGSVVPRMEWRRGRSNRKRQEQRRQPTRGGECGRANRLRMQTGIVASRHGPLYEPASILAICNGLSNLLALRTVEVIGFAKIVV